MSGRMPIWLADRLGIATESAADGATWQLESAWQLPPWATLLLVLSAIFFAVTLYARESSGAGRAYRALLIALRLVTLAIVLVMLAQLTIALRLTGPPSLALLIDRSASMGIADRYSQVEFPVQLRERLVADGFREPSRLDLAKLLLTGGDDRLLRELAARYRLQSYFVAGNVQRVSSTDYKDELTTTVRELNVNGSTSDATRLGDAVRQILSDSRGAHPAAIVVFTDGVTTAGIPLAAAANEARRRGVPIFAVGLGSAEPPRDIELADVLVDDAVFAGDIVNVQVQVKAAGLAGERAVVTLRRDNDSTPIVERPINLPAAGKTHSLNLTHRPSEPGQVAYIVEIEPHDDEINSQNNRQRRVVDVRDATIRVLLAFGYPSYEFRFLKTLLERDSTIGLATFLQDADPDYTEQDKTARRIFPANRDELFEYDVLILGDVDPRLLPRSLWPNLRAFVAENAGGVAFVAGSKYFPRLYGDLADVVALLPIEIADLAASPNGQLPGELATGFTVQPTLLGLQNPAFQLGDTPAEAEQIWLNLPPLYWLYPVSSTKPAAQILAIPQAVNPSDVPRVGASPPPPAPTTTPLILFQYVGPGRVLLHAIDSTWRWRIGAGDTYFARYWVQAIRYLARGKLMSGQGVELTADRREYRRNDTIELRARFRDPRLAPPGDEITAILETTAQPRQRITLHRNLAVANVFAASLRDLPQGEYELILAEPQTPGNPPTARFSVTAPPGEFARPEMDAVALQSAADKTGGKFYTIADADSLLAELPAGNSEPIENLPPFSLWNRWWMLAALLIVITSEWILRKRKGML